MLCYIKSKAQDLLVEISEALAASKGWGNAVELGAISSGFGLRHPGSFAKARMYIVAGFLEESGIPPWDHTLALTRSAEHGSQSRYNRRIAEFENIFDRTVFPQFHSLVLENGDFGNCLIAKSDWVGGRC